MKVYIQIGANVGNDDFFQKITSSAEQLIIHLIEPNKNLHVELQNNYLKVSQIHNVYIHGFAISTNNESKALNIYGNSGLSSLINRKSHQQKQNEVLVVCKTFNDFCDEWNIKNVDYMSIDTEGLDYEILNSIDIRRVNIQEIVFEEWPYVDDDLNKNFTTGEFFLNENVLPKYCGYTFSKIVLDGMNSFNLKKNTYL